MPNTLYLGDNLDVLRQHIALESVDLIYLDSPFNSKRDDNLPFKMPKGRASEAQITAFEDSRHWGDQAEHEHDEILQQPNTASRATSPSSVPAPKKSAVNKANCCKKPWRAFDNPS